MLFYTHGRECGCRPSPHTQTPTRPSQQTHTIVFGHTTSKSPESHPCERLLGDGIDANEGFVCCVCVCWYTHPCHPPPLYRFQEEHSIMSMVVSNDGTYLLLNLLNQVIRYQTRYTIPANMSSVCSKAAHTLFTLCPLQPVHLWNIKECSFVRRYQGLTQDFYTIHSCFGGPNNSYIASGSEGLLHGLELG